MSAGFKHFTDPFGAGINIGHGLLAGDTRDPTGKLFGKAPGADNAERTPVPLPTNPITAANAEVLHAQNDFARQNLLKKSIGRTILAGDTGGYNPAQPNSPLKATKPGNYMARV